jgi:hypothetical protein
MLHTYSGRRIHMLFNTRKAQIRYKILQSQRT